MRKTHYKLLSNGLYLIVHRLPYHNTVSINLRVDAGVRCETESQAGLAHFVEHLLFRGTQRWPSNYALNSQVESLGARMTGATHTEYTSYWLDTPRDYLPQTLPVFLDMLRNPLFTPSAITSEREVVLDEIAEIEEEGWQQAQFLLDQILWPNHPLGRSPLGRVETVQSLQLEDIQAFFARHYTPNRMVAAVVGDVQLATLVDLFEQGWGDWQSRSPATHHSPPSASPSTRLSYQRQDGGVLHLMFGFIIPPLNHPDLGAYMILWTLLGEGMSSRLYTALRGETGLCYSIESGVDELRHACVLNIYIATQLEQALQVFHRVRQVLHGLTTGKISPEELEHSRRQAIGTLVMKSDQVQFHARALSLSQFLTGHSLNVDEQIAQLGRVDLDDLRRAARETLHPANTYLSLVGPMDDQTWQRCQEIFGAQA